MTFTKFPSILTFNQEWLDKYILPHYGDVRCYVTEKIHGKSLTVEFDGTDFKYGRRKDYLQPGDKFGDLDYIKTQLETNVRRMYSEMTAVIAEHYEAADHAKEQGLEEVSYPTIPRDFSTITLRAEFFGGNYDHPDVPKVPNMGVVKSSGISYAQELSCSVYRVEVDGIILPMHDMGMLCLSFNIPHVPLLFTGTLRECLEWSAEHKHEDTVIPSGFPLLDAEGKVVMHPEVTDACQMLPKIEGNQREGHVIAPVDPITLPNGKEFLLKDKNEKFMETKFEKTPKPEVDPLAGDLGKLYQGILPKLTEARYHNVQSHNAEFGQGDFRKACGLVVQDAIDEFMLEAQEDSILWVGLTLHEKKTLTKRLNATCAERLREMFFGK